VQRDILVHHTGVNAEAQHRARGSSAWRGALDIEISVVPGETIEIVQRKSKDSEEATPVFAELQSVPIKGWMDEDGEQVTSAVLVAGVKPEKAKKDSPLARHQKTFENAWWNAGAEDINGEPYLTRSGFAAYLEREGHSDGTIKNYMKPSYEKGPIAMMQTAQIIRPHSNGWIILDQVWASALLMTRGK
jgi:putative DNA primase/helicase